MQKRFCAFESLTESAYSRACVVYVFNTNTEFSVICPETQNCNNNKKSLKVFTQNAFVVNTGPW